MEKIRPEESAEKQALAAEGMSTPRVLAGWYGKTVFLLAAAFGSFLIAISLEVARRVTGKVIPLIAALRYVVVYAPAGPEKELRTQTGFAR
jgi:TRAP-type uncharacterized transport system fused permease subunit